jgi:hypothetical protein
MAAIIPHLEVPEDVTPIERAYDMCVGSLSGDEFGEDHPECPAPQAVLADAHSGLLGMVFVRDAVFDSLQGLQFAVHPGNAQDKDAKKVYLVLDRPIGPGPAWNPATNPGVRQYKALSWTSKMNAPSWSLPAGAPQIGGACPGAVAGQSVVPEAARNANARLVNIGLGRPSSAPVNLAQAICEFCYATGGQYSTGQVQFAQILRFLWARQAINFTVQTPHGMSTAFVETMVYAIDNADYKLDGGTIKADPETNEPAQALPPEPTGRRFFRIHDSGDFFEEEYLRQWKMIADRLPDITFWAPSRIWATSWGIDAVNRINGNQRNLIIRPSAYETNEAGPGVNPATETGKDLGGWYDDSGRVTTKGHGTYLNGWAGATTVLSVKQNLGMSPEREQYVYEHAQRFEPKTTGPDPRYTWNCQAYATNDAKHTCRKAVAPPGLGGPDGKGCRACWIAPDEIVNYSLH